MGSVIGAGIGAVGSIIGGQQSAKAAKQSAMIQAAAADRAGERALTGYKYLTEGKGAAPMQGYIDAGQRALGNQGTTQNLMMDLLGITGYGNAQNPDSGGGAPAPAGPAPATGTNAFGGDGYGMGPGLTPQPSDAYLPQNGGFKPPPFTAAYQQQSGMFAPGVPMPAAGQPMPTYNYAPGQNALSYYSLPGSTPQYGAQVAPNKFGGMELQFGGPNGYFNPATSAEA